MDPVVQNIIDAAKRVASAEKLDVLDIGPVVLAVAALRSEGKISTTVADILGTKEIRWPEVLLSRADGAMASAAEESTARKFELGPTFKRLFNQLRKDAPGLPLRAFLGSILGSAEALTCPEVQTLRSAQVAANAAGLAGSTGLLGKLRDLSARSNRLEALLGEKVIGQQDAICMLASGYLRSIRSPAAKGLRGIFTFMGPPGVGKTMLAEHLADALTAVEGKRYECLKFGMEMADQESLILTIFGLEQTYGKAKHGLLHDAIKENPRQVLVFDEIEKAPPTIIQSFLTLLNDGSYRDRFDNSFVDLKECFVIFTTNLGQDIFASRNRSGILRGSAFSSDDLFDLLASAKRREHAQIDHAPAALSPEFVNRLRKGSAVLFNQLTGFDYQRLLDLVLCRKPGSEPNETAAAEPAVSVTEEAKQVLTLSFLPDISPRRVVSETVNLRERWIDGLLESPPAAILKADPKSFSLSVEMDPESQKFFAGLRADKRLKILVVDNDERMAGFIDGYVKEQFGDTIPTVDRVSDPSNTMEDILRFKPDILLLDLDLPDSSLPDGGALALHRRIMENAPDLPVFLFSESVEWEEKLPVILDQGGARGFFSFKEESSNILISDDQKVRFRRLLEDALFEKIMADLVRSRRKLDIENRFEFRESDNVVIVAISRLKHRQVVSLAEESGGIRPSEIPSVTFEDVFGLERAKERLRDAVDFMKNPGRLGTFGIRPPAGFLLAGPSGTGKTHLARAVANAAGCVFYSLSAGELESKWVGEGEERIRQLFAAARKYAPAVIFIDEIDAIAGDRTANSLGSSNHVKMLNQLLVCMDGFADTKGQILVLAATNRPEALDPAILRPGRFDETIRIEAPDAKAREQMFRKRLEKMPIEPGILDAIPRLICRTAGMSPAEIDRVIREAAYAAACEDRKTITLYDIETAIAFVRYGAARRDMKIDPKDRERTAWHEAGHAVVRLTLLPGSKLDFLSIVPNEDGMLGFAAWQHDETKHNESAEDFRKLIMVSLAGREGEKLCPGAGSDATNTGVSSDYEHATRRAWQYVTRFGFDEEFGIFAPATLPAHLQSELTACIQPRVQALLAECQQATEELLAKEKSSLEALVLKLLDKEALTGDEVAEVVQE